MEKLAADYLKRKKAALTGTRYAYEELVKTCLEMERGVYEKEAYERLGRRCGLAEYKILSVLLVQNLKKGNQSILELLEREAVSAGEERLRRARIQGEEASTKLLLPMILQLLVVFIILMVPAFIMRGGGDIMNLLKDLWIEEDAVGVVEIILILVVLIGLVIIFKEQLTSLVENILSKITSQSNSI